MAAYIENYEQEWLDLPVPALSGLTPRQAADDPTRRDDLVRLLASCPDPYALGVGPDIADPEVMRQARR